MEKVIMVQKQLNNCEWETVTTTKNKEVVDKFVKDLKSKNIKYRLSIYKGDAYLHPFRVTFQKISNEEIKLTININIANCLENEKIKTSDVVIRKKEDSFIVYLWANNENKAYLEATKYYRIHSEYLLRKAVS